MSPVSVGAALEAGARRLRAAGVENPRAEARLLLGHAASLTCEEILAHPERPLPPAAWFRYRRLVARRRRREPLAYLTGRALFCGREFAVDRRVLIPRPETELVAELAVAHLRRAGPREAPLLLADLGTGSGVLAVTLALELPGALVYAVDISAAALAVAAENARRLGVADRVRLLHGDLWAPLAAQGLRGRLDAVVANPPYVAERDLAGLMPEVREYEPAEALLGGPDGMECVRRVVTQAASFLRPGGALFVEVGAGQAAPAAALLRARGGWAGVEVHRDWAGWERVLVGVRGEEA